MPTATHALTEKVFREMVDLLEELMSAFTDADTEKEPDDDEGGITEEDLIAVMVEEAEDRGLDGELTERFLKSAVTAAKKSAEV